MNFFELLSMYTDVAMTGFFVYGLAFIPVWLITANLTYDEWKVPVALAVAFVLVLSPELYHFAQWHWGGFEKQLEMQMLRYDRDIVYNALKVKFWSEIAGGAAAWFVMNRFA
ncbi:MULTISPECIES: hypothetical protein [Burkholderia]|uniref:hypothetical protein n=1 Tax=Burkholderia TaxID=32008 RepID=UPI0007579DB0|nr:MULTISPECIES: hypothetical protein [Burkholderia]AOK00152.1 hypothetical protein WK23_16790 [Burkholderia vietnamiensis]